MQAGLPVGEFMFQFCPPVVGDATRYAESNGQQCDDDRQAQTRYRQSKIVWGTRVLEHKECKRNGK